MLKEFIIGQIYLYQNIKMNAFSLEKVISKRVNITGIGYTYDTIVIKSDFLPTGEVSYLAPSWSPDIYLIDIYVEPLERLFEDD